MTGRSLLVAGTGSNVGKTTVTLGLMSAFTKLGRTVQGFKCGPDYIDPSFQALITGCPSHNLDSWMCQDRDVKQIFSAACQNADIAIIEGVMGLFDGKSPLEDTGSSVEIARITKTPILLVLDCSGMARSAAAVVKGYQALAKDAEIIGLVANFVGSEGHFKLIEAAVKQLCGIPVFGYLTKEDMLKIPERKLGLAPVDKAQLSQFADLFIKQFDLGKLEAKMGKVVARPISINHYTPSVRIGVLKDQAFPFYYQANLNLLKQYGAEIIAFSLLNDGVLPNNLDGVYLGGGFPELYAETLISRQITKSLKTLIEQGLPVYAEGGGFMLLLDAIIQDNGKKTEMLGILPGETVMQTRLAGFGYREVEGTDENPLLKPSEVARGHVYHYGHLSLKEAKPAYTSESDTVSIATEQIIASNVHLHFYSAPQIAERMIEMCKAYSFKR